MTVDGTVLGFSAQNIFVTTSAGAGGVAYGSFQFYGRLSELPGYTDATNFYEAYRINKISLKITPFCTASSTAAAASSAAGQPGVIFHYALDPDDSSRPANSEADLEVLRQKQGYRSRNIYAGQGRPITITFKPKVVDKSTDNLSTAMNVSRPASWIDCSYPDVAHLGVKGIIESISGGAVQLLYYKVEAKYFVSLKGVQ